MKALECDTNKRKRLFMDSSIITLLVIGVIVVILLIVLSSAIRVVQQYERGVIFVLGRLIGAKVPGIFLVPPFITRMPTVDRPIGTLTAPPQEQLHRTNLTLRAPLLRPLPT